MLNFILRGTWLKSYSKEEQNVCLMLRGYIITKYLLEVMMHVFIVVPLIIVIARLSQGIIKKDINIIWLIIGAIGILYGILCVILIRTHKIEEIKELLFSKLYFYLLTFKGKAISYTDWKTIKKLDEKCYNHIMKQECKGYCYDACFRILQCLKDGTMKFVSVLNPGGDGRHTMHVLYVNNSWCFDTYSQRQYPIEKVMKIYKAIEYKDFSYSDIEGKTYREFREEHYPELREWCRENNIEQRW